MRRHTSPGATNAGHGARTAGEERPLQRRLLTALPVGISLLRLLLTPTLLSLSRRGARRRWAAMVVLLVTADLADGVLARRIAGPPGQRCQRQVDGLADAALFAVAPVCVYRLRPEVLRQERVPLVFLAAAQAASLVACTAKFGRLPRYRSVAFRWSAGALGVALAGRVADVRLTFPFRVAALAYFLANIEAVAITLLLERYRQPVLTLAVAVAGRRR